MPKIVRIRISRQSKQGVAHKPTRRKVKAKRVPFRFVKGLC